MNKRVNLYNKPYIVLEGHADCSLQPISKELKFENEEGKKVIVYAGSLLKLYGIQNLVEGFIKANIPNSELCIFGDGDYREELQSVSIKNDKIKYMGVRQNREIVDFEQKASLLVNPRPTAPEYTKYSFPSKNMEVRVANL